MPHFWPSTGARQHPPCHPQRTYAVDLCPPPAPHQSAARPPDNGSSMPQGQTRACWRTCGARQTQHPSTTALAPHQQAHVAAGPWNFVQHVLSCSTPGSQACYAVWGTTMLAAAPPALHAQPAQLFTGPRALRRRPHPALQQVSAKINCSKRTKCGSYHSTGLTAAAVMALRTKRRQSTAGH